jgi:hypothetical protein
MKFGVHAQVYVWILCQTVVICTLVLSKALNWYECFKVISIRLFILSEQVTVLGGGAGGPGSQAGGFPQYSRGGVQPGSTSTVAIGAL